MYKNGHVRMMMMMTPTPTTTPPVIVVYISIVFTLLLPTTAAIRCYKCTTTMPSPYTNETVRLCAHFEHTEHYIIDCPYSTLCMKKDFTVNLTVPINGTERGCARQRYEYQNYENGKWQLKVAIEEPYIEGCSHSDDKGFRTSRTEFCYCRGDLCNHGVNLHDAHARRTPIIILPAVMLVLYHVIMR